MIREVVSKVLIKDAMRMLMGEHYQPVEKQLRS